MNAIAGPKVTAVLDHGGRLSLIAPGAPCPGCGCEPDVDQYYVRTFERNGEPVKVRVGYHCTCSAVVVDGFVVGARASR